MHGCRKQCTPRDRSHALRTRPGEYGSLVAEGRSSVVELLVTTVRVLGVSPTKNLVHAKWIAFAILLFLNDLYLSNWMSDRELHFFYCSQEPIYWETIQRSVVKARMQLLTICMRSTSITLLGDFYSKILLV